MIFYYLRWKERAGRKDPFLKLYQLLGGLAMYLHEIPEGISLYITDAGSQSQGGSQWTVLTTPTLKLPEKDGSHAL